jgi:hypothetical protein
MPADITRQGEPEPHGDFGLLARKDEPAGMSDAVLEEAPTPLGTPDRLQELPPRATEQIDTTPLAQRFQSPNPGSEG